MSKPIKQEEFIRLSKQIHGNKYDYSKVNYVNNKTNVCIICPEHGEFWQRPSHHLDGHGCKKCSSSKPRKKRGVGYNSLGKEEFVKRAVEKFGDRYDYSKVIYVNCDTKVDIICPIHGIFHQTPYNHLKSNGCPKCFSETNHIIQRKSKEQFISDSIKLFGNMYDYTECKYLGNKIPIKVICKKCGKSFYVTPHNHLIHKEGCPYCKLSKMEIHISKLLEENKIVFEQQKVFDWLVNGKSVKSLDFYLPEYNIAIECQGLQHFKPIKYFGGEDYLKRQQNNDSVKKELCKEHGIDIIYYSDKEYDFPYEVYTDCNRIMEKLNRAANRDN